MSDQSEVAKRIMTRYDMEPGITRIFELGISPTRIAVFSTIKLLEIDIVAFAGGIMPLH